MSGESQEDLRHQAAEDRREEVREKTKEKEKKHLLIMTKLDAQRYHGAECTGSIF